MNKLMTASVSTLFGCAFASVIGKFGWYNIFIILSSSFLIALVLAFPLTLLRSLFNPIDSPLKKFEITKENFNYLFVVATLGGVIFFVHYFSSFGHFLLFWTIIFCTVIMTS